MRERRYIEREERSLLRKKLYVVRDIDREYRYRYREYRYRYR